MGSITIYGIKNCDTMKKARAWLDGHGVAYDFHDYKTAGIDKFMSECRALTNLVGNGVACIVISLSEGELDKDKLHETMAHPIRLGEALEPGAA